jgi:hypothetical protein
MASNQFLQWYNQNNEQNLFEDLTVESIRNFAHDIKYLPRTELAIDHTLNEIGISEYTTALDVEVYVKNADSFEGDGQLLAKFGLEIRDQMTLVMSIRSFQQFIQPYTNKSRPEEGDCLFIPMLGVIYQIKYVNSSAQFYTLGKLMSYEIVCELLEFNNEQFRTNIAEIDDKYKAYQNASADGYNLESYDNSADNSSIEVISDSVLDFGESDPFGVIEH